MPDDGQSEPQTSVLSGRRPIGLSEPFKDMREKARVNTGAAVTHLDANMRSLVDEIDMHVAPLRGESHSVRKQIPHYLLQSFGVT